MEVATALRARKRVIPVLVRRAVLPLPAVLPEDLLALTKCQAITIRDEAWMADVDRLIDAIGHPYRWDLLVLRILIAAVVIILGDGSWPHRSFAGRLVTTLSGVLWC